MNVGPHRSRSVTSNTIVEEEIHEAYTGDVMEDPGTLGRSSSADRTCEADPFCLEEGVEVRQPR